MSLKRCCRTCTLISVGVFSGVPGAILIFSEEAYFIGTLLLLIGVVMVVAAVTICRKGDEPAPPPVSSATVTSRNTTNLQQPFMEQHVGNQQSVTMETNLHGTSVVYSNQPSAPSFHQMGASNSPPPFSASFAYPLAPTSHNFETAPPSYAEAVGKSSGQ